MTEVQINDAGGLRKRRGFGHEKSQKAKRSGGKAEIGKVESWQFLVICSLFLVPRSLFLVPRSLFVDLGGLGGIAEGWIAET